MANFHLKVKALKLTVRIKAIKQTWEAAVLNPSVFLLILYLGIKEDF